VTVRNPELLRADDTALLIIDVQERFRPQIAAFDRMVGRIRSLARAAALLDVPVVVTEQYPSGLGATVAELGDALAAAERLEKVEFSAVAAPGFDDLLRRLGRGQLLLTGIEAHVCVHQTATELLARGLSVHLAADAIESRDPANRAAGVARMLADGAHESSVEMAIFELLRTASHDRFRDTQAIVKELPAYAAEPDLEAV
jgi:nicotinamidase-related amidase